MIVTLERFLQGNEVSICPQALSRPQMYAAVRFYNHQPLLDGLFCLQNMLQALLRFNDRADMKVSWM
jgi:hypothetical protein